MGKCTMNDASTANGVYPGRDAALAALHRAAQAARQLAIDTNTHLVVFQNGKVVRIPPQELRKQQREAPETPSSLASA